MENGDIYRQAGLLILGSRLRRLSTRLLTEVGTVYREKDLPFETGWFPLFFLLDREGPLPVTELARRLKVSQSAVSQQALGLEERGLVALVRDPGDGRRRSVTFTPAGKRLLERIRPVWTGLADRLEDYLAGPETAGLLAALGSFEDELDRRSLSGEILAALETADKE